MNKSKAQADWINRTIKKKGLKLRITSGYNITLPNGYGMTFLTRKALAAFIKDY